MSAPSLLDASSPISCLGKAPSPLFPESFGLTPSPFSPFSAYASLQQIIDGTRTPGIEPPTPTLQKRVIQPLPRIASSPAPLSTPFAIESDEPDIPSILEAWQPPSKMYRASFPNNPNLEEKVWKALNTVGTIQPSPKGKNGALLVFEKEPENDPKDKPFTIFKPRRKEIGTKLRHVLNHQEIPDPDDIQQILGFKSGQEAITEYISYSYIKHILSKINPEFLQGKIIIPETFYVTLASKELFFSTYGEKPYPTEKQGALIEFIPDCESCNTDILKQLDSFVIQLIIIIDILLMNTDRNYENILTRLNQHVVLIDHGLCLPNHGEKGLMSYFFRALQSKETIHEDLKSLIMSLNENDLSNIITKIQEQLKKQDQLDDTVQFDENGQIDKDTMDHKDFEFIKSRTLTHKFALKILQEGIKQDLSLYEIGILLRSSDNETFISESVAVHNIILSLIREIRIQLNILYNTKLSEEEVNQNILSHIIQNQQTIYTKIETLLKTYAQKIKELKEKKQEPLTDQDYIQIKFELLNPKPETANSEK